MNVWFCFRHWNVKEICVCVSANVKDFCVCVPANVKNFFVCVSRIFVSVCPHYHFDQSRWFFLVPQPNITSMAFHSSMARKPEGRGKSCVAAHLRVWLKLNNFLMLSFLKNSTNLYFTHSKTVQRSLLTPTKFLHWNPRPMICVLGAAATIS